MFRPRRLLEYLAPPRKRSPDFEEDVSDSDGSDGDCPGPCPHAPPGAPHQRRPHNGTLISSAQSHPLTIFRCRKCQAHLAPYSLIISKSFTGRLGRAILVSDVHNIKLGKAGQRMLVTGLHTVADITCASCDVVVGWKYIDAFERNQAYKVGKYILELNRVVKETVAVAEDDRDPSQLMSAPLDLRRFDLENKSQSTPLRRGSTSLALRQLLDDEGLRISLKDNSHAAAAI